MKKQLLKWLGIALFAISVLPASSWATGYTQTQYPIILVHGLFGFDSIAGLDYFYGIPQALSADGAQVFVAEIASGNSTEVRGEELLTYVKQVLAATGATKVNLIGHSHGGPTARYVASVAPALVASVTSIGGPNKGAAVADIVRGVVPPGTFSEYVLGSVATGFTTLINALSGGSDPENAVAALDSLTTAGMAKFNLAHPEGVPTTACGEGDYQVNGVSYFSWNGAQPATNFFDPSDPGLWLASLAYGGAKNDGMASSCGSHLGRVIRDDYGMNHLDEVNQIVGLVNIFETNPTTVYRQQANRLQGLGL